METSTVFGQNLGYFRGMGVGRSNFNSVLPPQAIPERKKNDKWKQSTLDNLEIEAIRQYKENLPMADYYRMVTGEMAYMDIDEDDRDSLYNYVTDFKSRNLNLPSYLKHWDLMYPLVSKIIGDWSLQYDKFRFDTIDEVSTNEFIAERTNRLLKFSEALFKSQLDKMMLLSGLEVKDEFQSEEEMQQYQGQLDGIIKDYFPDNIDKDMKKNWKTEAAQWAEKTWERDYDRFRISILEALEGRDILLTGKSARHYRIGYDYYYPEHWHPIEVFHSKESGVERMEDCEFVGRLKFYTITELMNTYGDIINENNRKSIYRSFFGDSYEETYEPSTSQGSMAILGEGMFDRMSVPFKGYNDHLLSLEFEEATGIPLSERTDLATGDVKPVFSVPIERAVASLGAQISQSLRTDIQIRTDTIPVVEAYVKGFKKIGMLCYRELNGYINTIEIDENILPDVLKKYKIKNQKNVSLSEFKMLSDEDRVNKIVWIDAPIVYKAIKMRIGGVGNDMKDIYHMEELKFQIRGEKGNLFDIKLPVTGRIGNSYCKLIRPEQITYNYLLNQNQGYLEKEIGSFFVIDVNSIPSQHFDLGDGEDALIGMRNIAKTTGLLPTDLGRNHLNQQSGGMLFNPMVYQNATFTDQLMRNLQMANTYKWMAYEKLGITPQSMGSPSEYATNEGIKVGQKATFAQTYGIDQVLLENKRSNIEVHLTVAQYCQINNKDSNHIYMASNNELGFIQTIKDDNFNQRKIAVRPIYDPKKTMDFQLLKQSLFQNNTMGHDALSMTELFISDDYMELKEAAIRAREYATNVETQRQQSAERIAQGEMQKELQIHSEEIRVKDDKNRATVKAAELAAQGRVGDNLNDGDAYKMLEANAKAYLDDKKVENQDKQASAKIQADLIKTNNAFSAKIKELDIRQQQVDNEREKISAMKYNADTTRFNSIINKN